MHELMTYCMHGHFFGMYRKYIYIYIWYKASMKNKERLQTTYYNLNF